MQMSNQTYDNIKLVALLIVPAATFVMSLLTIFGVVDNSTATAILAALDTFIGSVVVVSKKVYDNQMQEDQQG